MASKKPTAASRIEDAVDELNDTVKFLTDRIVGMHEIRSQQGERHAFILYRKMINDAIGTLEGR